MSGGQHRAPERPRIGIMLMLSLAMLAAILLVMVTACGAPAAHRAPRGAPSISPAPATATNDGCAAGLTAIRAQHGPVMRIARLVGSDMLSGAARDLQAAVRPLQAAERRMPAGAPRDDIRRIVTDEYGALSALYSGDLQSFARDFGDATAGLDRFRADCGITS